VPQRLESYQELVALEAKSINRGTAPSLSGKATSVEVTVGMAKCSVRLLREHRRRVDAIFTLMFNINLREGLWPRNQNITLPQDTAIWLLGVRHGTERALLP
jgi:hypothetical protein